MKTLKRIFITLLSFVLACGMLTGCNDTPANSGSGGSSGSKLAAPTIRVEEGSSTNIIWDSVEGALSYVVSVNGMDYPATANSYLLADNGAYTVSVRAIAAKAEYNSDPSNTLNLSYGFNEDAVVLRFAALSDVHVSAEKGANKLRDVMLKTLEKYDIDAFLFAGDLTNAQNSDKNAVPAQIALFAAGTAQGNEYANLPLVWCFGNHDFPNFALDKEQSFTNPISGLSYTFPIGTANYDSAMEILADATSTFFSEDAWPDTSRRAPGGFRYNKIKGFSFIAVDYTNVTSDSMLFLEKQLDALSALEPNKQIFVTSHMPQNSNQQPRELTDLLKRYPQVVYLSGHSHDTLQTYSAIVSAQGFLEFNLGPGDHAPYGVDGPGTAYNLYQMKQGAIIEVDASGHMRFLGIDYSIGETDYGFETTLDQSYVVAENPMVIRTAYFAAPTRLAQSPVLYDSVVNSKNDERYHDPIYAETPVMNFMNLSKDGGKMGIPAADAANVIIYYSITVKDNVTGELVSIYDKQAKAYATALKTPANHIYYPSGDYMPSTLWLDLKFEKAMDISHEYTVYLKGVDDFGKSTPEYAFSLSLQSATYRSTGAKVN